MSRSPVDVDVDVAVVGGGVIGLAVAWQARLRGLSVTLFDRGALGHGASHVAAGMLAPVAEAEFGPAGERLTELGIASAAAWPQFATRLRQASGIDPGLRPSGALMVARDRDEAEVLERELAFCRRRGLAARRMLPSEARRLEPALAPTVRLALEHAQDHSVDPRAVLTGLAVAAARAGVTLRPMTEVAELLLSQGGDRIVGVTLAGGERVRAGIVVVAAGAWSGPMPGLPEHARVPVRPVKGQILRLRDPSGPGLVGRVLRFEDGYLVPRTDGRYVLGATVEEQGFDTTVTAGALWELLDGAMALVPGISEFAIEELQAGLRPGTPDNLPIIGPGALDGLVWATGHHRNGVLLAPVTVEVVLGVLGLQKASPLAGACSAQRFSTDASTAGPATSAAAALAPTSTASAPPTAATLA